MSAGRGRTCLGGFKMGEGRDVDYEFPSLIHHGQKKQLSGGEQGT